jgi:hypothetical protein
VCNQAGAEKNCRKSARKKGPFGPFRIVPAYKFVRAGGAGPPDPSVQLERDAWVRVRARRVGGETLHSFVNVSKISGDS